MEGRNETRPGVSKTRRFLLAFVTIATSSMACGDGRDTDDSGDTAVDPDCPREYTAEEFLAEYVQPFCEHTTTCLGDPEYTVGDCVSLYGSTIRQTSCWNPCEAGQCAVWLDGVDECMDPPGSFPQVCVDMVNCETNP